MEYLNLKINEEQYLQIKFDQEGIIYDLYNNQDELIKELGYTFYYEINNLHRLKLIETLMKLRKNWNKKDYQEFFDDLKNIEKYTLKELKDMMETNIHHTYDIFLLKDCIENEKL